MLTIGYYGGQMVALPGGTTGGDPRQVPPRAHGTAAAEEDHAPPGGHVQYRPRLDPGETGSIESLLYATSSSSTVTPVQSVIVTYP